MRTSLPLLPPTPTPHDSSGEPPRGRAPPRMVDVSELQRLLSRGFGTENIWVPAAKPDHPQASSWLGTVAHDNCVTVAHRNCTLPLVSEGFWRRQCLQYPIGPRAVPYPEMGDRCLRDCLVPASPARSAGHYPAYPELPERAPVPPLAVVGESSAPMDGA